MMLLSKTKSIAKYGKFVCLKGNEVPYLQAQVLGKSGVLGARQSSHASVEHF